MQGAPGSGQPRGQWRTQPGSSQDSFSDYMSTLENSHASPPKISTGRLMATLKRVENSEYKNPAKFRFSHFRSRSITDTRPVSDPGHAPAPGVHPTARRAGGEPHLSCGQHLLAGCLAGCWPWGRQGLVCLLLGRHLHCRIRTAPLPPPQCPCGILLHCLKVKIL